MFAVALVVLLLGSLLIRQLVEIVVALRADRRDARDSAAFVAKCDAERTAAEWAYGGSNL